MARPRRIDETNDPYTRRLEIDRVRAQRYRDRAATLGRPSPAMVDRAILKAIREVWQAQLDRIAGADPKARAAALRQGVDLVDAGGRAVEWLCRCGRADRDEARTMVLARLRGPKAVGRTASR